MMSYGVAIDVGKALIVILGKRSSQWAESCRKRDAKFYTPTVSTHGQ